MPRNTPCYFLAKIENPSGTDWGLHQAASPAVHQHRYTSLPLAARYSAAK
ncbi:hypothetical protein [Coprobacter fastidiosus]|nr:hypothetical protein [Coprobacter fastidiosus]